MQSCNCISRSYDMTETKTDPSTAPSLKTRVDIECRPASYRTARGGTCVAIICDELAFWRSEATANPDVEILNAVRPSLATTGGMLAAISSPYAKRVELYSTYRRDFGPTGDPSILLAKAASRTMNPSLSQKVIDRAYARDSAVASAEFGGEFRQDLEQFVSREVVEACIDDGVYERGPLREHGYTAFVDPSGGSADSMTLAVSHRERDVAVLAAVRDVKPPFSPEAVVADFAALLKTYRITTVSGDRYGGEWPRERFREHGISYVPAERTRSEIYIAFLPLLNSRKAWLLDDSKLVAQLCGLERRTSRAGY
jgi:hypothetical protein